MATARLQEWAFRCLNRFAGDGKAAGHLETGIRGEKEAFFHLRRTGYTVVARRWTSAKVRGDLDLIAWSNQLLCFIEVKTRTTRHLIPAEAAVDLAKRTQMRRLGRAYLAGFEEEGRSRIETRFDVVSVYLSGTDAVCELIDGAFGWTER